MSGKQLLSNRKGDGVGSNRLAVVTGAASGIGLGVARQLAADGHRVALMDLAAEGAEQAAADLRSQGFEAVSAGVDVADWAGVRAAFDQVRAQLGRVSILVTSAGIDSFDSVLDIRPESWDRVLAVNLTGTFTCAQAALPDMVESRWGRIVTISSQAGQSGSPRMAHYAASKGGVISLTKALAREFADKGVTANTIPPSIIDTPMARKAESLGLYPPVDTVGKTVPVGRVGTPEDIAAACSFLCSDGASYITGQVIAVNGGAYV
jgi:NAD(P)-dependent dehydrogenase (short-subunit alcohol dehydrogenase family)